jgi:AcrR family transcriptional regulator
MGKQTGSLQDIEPRRKLAAPERRSQLVSIAVDLIAAKGFEGLRFQEVAERAGINNGTLAYHFASKEELITGVMRLLSEELQRPPAPLAGPPPTALEELRLEFERMGELLRTRARLLVVFVELSLRGLRDPTIEGVTAALDDDCLQHLLRIVRHGMREGTFRADLDADAAAVALVVQIKGIGFHAMTGGLDPGLIQRTVAEIARQAEYWLTGRGV